VRKVQAEHVDPRCPQRFKALAIGAGRPDRGNDFCASNHHLSLLDRQSKKLPDILLSGSAKFNRAGRKYNATFVTLLGSCPTSGCRAINNRPCSQGQRMPWQNLEGWPGKNFVLKKRRRANFLRRHQQQLLFLFCIGRTA
jgi:hypothetical protein